MVGHFLGCATEEFGNCVVAEVKLISTSQVDDSGERNDASDAGFVCGETKRELASGGVSHHQKLMGIEVALAGALQEEVVGVANVGEGVGPGSAFIANPAILKVGGGGAFAGERGTEVGGVVEVVLRTPEASVNIDDCRMRPLRLGKTKVSELIRIGAVGDTGIRGRRSESENVVGGHLRIIDR